MSDIVAAKNGANQWSALLEQTRQSLACLDSETLEELAARAECMFAATIGLEPVRQRLPKPQQRDMLAVSREHRLLGSVLLATDTNLKVLRRNHSGEVNSRWVR